VTLVVKEARDVRGLVLGLAVASALLAVGARAVFGGFGGYPSAAGAFGVFGVAVLGGAVVAAELFAGEFSGRRIETTVLLPVRLGTLWTAKALTAVLATCALAVPAAAAHLGAFALWGSRGQTAEFVASLPQGALVVALGIPVLALALLAATVVESPLAALLAATLAGGAVAFGATRFPWADYELGSVHQAAALGVATLVALAASRLAFVRGPIHVRARGRRLALGAGLPVLILGGGSVAAWAALDARFTVVPGDPRAAVTCVEVAPDGRRAALLVGVADHRQSSWLWMLDLECGRLDALGGETHVRWASWADDRLLTVQTDEGPRSIMAATLEDSDLVPRPDPTATRPWWRSEARRDPLTQKALRDFAWVDRGIVRTFADADLVVPSPRPGHVLVRPRTGATRLVDLATDTSRELDDPGARVRFADGGRLVLSGNSNRTDVLDVETGVSHRWDRPVWLLMTPGSASRWAIAAPRAHSAEGWVLQDLRTGDVALRAEPGRALEFVRGRHDGRFVAEVGGGVPVRVHDLVAGRSFTPDAQWDLVGHSAARIHALPGDGLLLVGRDGRFARVDAAGRPIGSAR
jgi:hypothetical protein